MFIDGTYLVFVLPAMLFAMWAQARVRGAFDTYSKVPGRSGLTASQMAAFLLSDAGLGDVAVERQKGRLTDHYDPRQRVLRLSDSTYGDRSVAAIAVAAHEVGHAVQHSVGYAPLALRNSIVPVVSFGSQAAFPLFFIGLLTQAGTLMDIGLLFFFGAVIFHLVTLPVEFNASRRALEMLQVSGRVDPAEVVPMGNVLNAAALTYIAATAVALGQFLRMLSLRGRSRR